MPKTPHAFVLSLAVVLSTAFAGAAIGAETPKPKPKASAAKSAAKPAPAKTAKGKKPGGKAADKKAEVPKGPGPLADFGSADASDDVRHVANWVSYTRNNFAKAFVLIDKKEATMYVFDAKGKLKGRSPILLGKAIGDHTVPGIGNKPFSQIKDEEMTTPAGRFWAQPGKNNRGEGIIWIDYKAAVSMHRMRTVAAEQKRAERMSTPEASDNRISYGCVNVPAKFYDTVLSPAARKPGAFVYVLPETKTPQQFFGTVDVPPGAKG